MSISFSRSLQSLHNDNFKGTRWIVWLGLLVLILWGLWFLLAPSTLYETSAVASIQTQADLAPSGVATFPLALAAKIQPGQAAQFHPKDPATLGNRYSNITATIKEVKKTAQALEVAFLVQLPSEAYVNFPQNIQGSLEVEVGHTTPVNLIFGSATGFVSKVSAFAPASSQEVLA